MRNFRVMQNDDRGFYSAIGLARKAGKIVAGTVAVTQAVGRRKVRLVIVTEDLGTNTLNKIKAACNETGAELISYGSSEMLGNAIGRESIKIIGIIDRNFIKLILSKMQIEWR
ncbi:MAG TPA: ribosomal L7Ae/L30e/S12e/Gadd45 family protein [Clostridia bacterium]|nr:ribosomal L7Ae/L30e/S12e/Gadd45 family protein [Clostridia bacterium]